MKCNAQHSNTASNKQITHKALHQDVTWVHVFLVVGLCDSYIVVTTLSSLQKFKWCLKHTFKFQFHWFVHFLCPLNERTMSKSFYKKWNQIYRLREQQLFQKQEGDGKIWQDIVAQRQDWEKVVRYTNILATNLRTKN